MGKGLVVILSAVLLTLSGIVSDCRNDTASRSEASRAAMASADPTTK